MASNSDDERMQVVEETVGRRTRSGRAVKSPIASVPTTRTRGSKKKVEVEIDRHPIDEDASQEVVEREIDSTSENSNGLSQIFQTEDTTVPQYLESDSNQSGGRDIPFPEISQDFLNNSSTVDFTITEENANSFQSTMEDVEESNIDSQIIEMNDSNIANSTFDLVQKETSQELLNVKVEKVEEKQETAPVKIEVKEEKEVQKVTEVPIPPKINEEDVRNVILKFERKSVGDEDVEMKELDEKVSVKGVPSDAKQDTDTEMVSEDELPAPPKAKVPEDTEEVSDDELPGPRLAELPEDTEVVSEDELPSVKAAAGIKRKREEAEGYNPGSPTEEATEEKIPKRAASESSDKEKEEKKAPTKPRKLPELDKYWKAVNDDPADFTGWTYLLQYVDQENEIEPAREAYDAFLAHYPYCYGYWRKYSDYEKRKGNKKKCEEVFERGLKAIPLSVDLWLHFLTYLKTTYPDDETRIREQFERALSACGLEFRSDRLWEAYIKWETEGKRLSNVMQIYDRLLATPTLGYTGHFESFQEFIAAHPPTDILPVTEFVAFRQESRNSKKDSPIDSDTPPGEDEADDNIRNDEECEAIRELIISSRRKIHKITVNEVTARWSFEEGIKRPYFHVKPLERCQINNWKEYLDYEIQKGDRQRVLILYERALIACALYDEFWLRLIRYLESQNDPELVAHTRDVFERACLVHHPDKPNLHLLWAAFEEGQSNYPKAAEILTNLEKTCPNLLQVSYRRINLERRRGDYEKVCSLFENYIQSTKNKTTASGLVIKYARFTHKIRGDMEKALEIIKNGIEKDPANARLYLQAIDLAMQREKVDEKEIIDVMDSFLARDIDLDQKVLFAQRKLEFLEDFGTTAEGLQAAMRGLQQALVKANKKKEKGMGDMSPSKKSKDSSSGNPPLPPSGSYQGSNSQYGQYGGSGTQTQGGPYGSYQGAAGSYGQGYPQSGGDYSSYNWGQYGQNYGGYGQWGGSYPNYY